MKRFRIKPIRFLTAADYWLQLLMWLIVAAVVFETITGRREEEIMNTITVFFIVWSSMMVSAGISTIERDRMKRKIKKIRFI